MRELTFEEYARMFGGMEHTVFDSPAFVGLNAARAKQVHFLEHGGVGIALGSVDDATFELTSPFSAPYATYCGCGDISAFVRELHNCCGGRSVRFVCPPPVYGCSDFAVELMRFARHTEAERNYHFNLVDFERRLSMMRKDARYKLNRARRHNFTMHKTDDLAGAYDLIARHHAQLGYEMAMSAEAFRATDAVVQIDIFKYMVDGNPAGAAIVYHAAPGIVQLINWGDEIELRRLNTMSFMADATLEYYWRAGAKIFDFGPVMLHGAINEGLDEFKRSLGCVATEKAVIYW